MYNYKQIVSKFVLNYWNTGYVKDILTFLGLDYRAATLIKLSYKSVFQKLDE